MKVWTKITHVWDESTQCYRVDESESEHFEYQGAVDECKPDSAPAPTPDPAIGQAAMDNIKLGKDWLSFAKEQFAVGNDRQVTMDAVADKVVENQLATQEKTNARADEQWAQHKSTFLPIEEKVAAEAINYDTPEKQAAAAAAARADVENNAAIQRNVQQRSMAGMGINPTSGRYAGVDRNTQLNTALIGAGAENKARQGVRDMGIMLRKDAAGLGRNLTGTAAQSYGIGLQAGNSAVGNQSAANANFFQNQNTMTQGFQGAQGANSSGAGILSNLYGKQLDGWAAQQQANATSSAGVSSAVGSLAGAAMMMSSKEVKENKSSVDGALDAVSDMPVERWDYKQGVADGGTHVGPYAEDFRAKTGLGDGKTINVIDAVGVTMKAVQELNKKVDQLGKKERKK